MSRGLRAHGVDQAEVRHRALTLLTLFLYMVAELSAIGQVVTALTGLYGLPVIIVECIITTIYTCKFSAIPISYVEISTCLDYTRC